MSFTRRCHVGHNKTIGSIEELWQSSPFKPSSTQSPCQRRHESLVSPVAQVRQKFTVFSGQYNSLLFDFRYHNSNMHHQGFGMGVGTSQMGVGATPPAMHHHHHMSPLLGTGAAAGLGLSSNGMVSVYFEKGQGGTTAWWTTSIPVAPTSPTYSHSFSFCFSQVGALNTLDWQTINPRLHGFIPQCETPTEVNRKRKSGQQSERLQQVHNIWLTYRGQTLNFWYFSSFLFRAIAISETEMAPRKDCCRLLRIESSRHFCFALPISRIDWLGRKIQFWLFGFG